MKVRDLIEELQKLDPELEIVLQKDDEGNGYRRMYGADDDAFVSGIDFTTEYELYIYAEEDLEEMEDEERADYGRVVVFY